MSGAEMIKKRGLRRHERQLKMGNSPIDRLMIRYKGVDFHLAVAPSANHRINLSVPPPGCRHRVLRALLRKVEHMFSEKGLQPPRNSYIHTSPA